MSNLEEQIYIVDFFEFVYNKWIWLISIHLDYDKNSSHQYILESKKIWFPLFY